MSRRWLPLLVSFLTAGPWPGMGSPLAFVAEGAEAQDPMPLEWAREMAVKSPVQAARL